MSRRAGVLASHLAPARGAAAEAQAQGVDTAVAALQKAVASLNELNARDISAAKAPGRADGATPQQKAGRNVVLGDQSLPPQNRPHKVALCEWPLDNVKHNGEARTASLHALFSYVKGAGYDGIECTPQFFEKYFFGQDLDIVSQAPLVRAEAAKYGMQVFGANVWWVRHDLWAKPNFLQDMRDTARAMKLMGGGYISYQVWLSAEHQDTGGAYRRDKAYLNLCAERIIKLHEICFAEGLNCYIESHIQRITEDPQAFREILEICESKGCYPEMNGDLSHYVYRNYVRGPDIDYIMARMGHTHQRMARVFGDLSVDPGDCKKDWESKGVTWAAWALTKKGLKGGISSRVVTGESGPFHLVTDPITVDAKLVPLWRAMAKYADQSARLVAAKDPSDPADPQQPWN